MNLGFAVREGDWYTVGFETVGVAVTVVAVIAAKKLGPKMGPRSARGPPAATQRVKLRMSVRQEIEAKQPRNTAGQMVDPNSGQPLKPGEIDIGHKPGQEWHKRKQMHGERGSTRKEVIETENNHDLYHLEDRSSNRMSNK
ncbi:MAG TPA: GH-E family nuclease [Polyangium sp.]|nr:GH-E family nuclease [Polyangium sp.]